MYYLLLIEEGGGSCLCNKENVDTQSPLSSFCRSFNPIQTHLSLFPHLFVYCFLAPNASNQAQNLFELKPVRLFADLSSGTKQRSRVGSSFCLFFLSWWNRIKSETTRLSPRCFDSGMRRLFLFSLVWFFFSSWFSLKIHSRLVLGWVWIDWSDGIWPELSRRMDKNVILNLHCLLFALFSYGNAVCIFCVLHFV